MSSIVKDMGNKESIKQAEESPGDMASIRDEGVLKATASVRGLDNYKQNFLGVHKPSTSQNSQFYGPIQSPVQNDRKKFGEDIVPQRENVMQNYAGLQQAMFGTSGYVNGGTVFSGQMIPPMLMQQPMQVPATIPGMFQTGFMYQTLSKGTAKPNSHFFPPFTKGSLIMLGTGGLKPIEDLKTTDFFESAEVSKQLCLETSKIAKIQELPSSAVSLIGFAVDNYESEVLVEKPSDHPFFIYEQGWASCKPHLTLSRYGLQCKQLKIGDVCIFLSDKVDTRSDRPMNCESKSVVEDKDKQYHIAPHGTALSRQNRVSEANDITKPTESGDSNISGVADSKIQPKGLVKKEDESYAFGQSPGKKAKLDIPSNKNVDLVKS